MKYQRARDYIEVLKPRASILLTFIGVCSAIIAGDGQLSPRLLLIALTIFATPFAAADDAEAIANRIGVTDGICALLGDTECQLALDLAQRTNLTFFVQLASAEDVAAAARAADAAGLYGTRIFVARGSRSRIGLAENVADALVDVNASMNPSRAELVRVLRPGGRAIQGSGELLG